MGNGNTRSNKKNKGENLMVKIIKKLQCISCEYYDKDGYCNYSIMTMGRRIKDKNTIPDWCQLEDLSKEEGNG